jgi:hypothetical protein
MFWRMLLYRKARQPNTRRERFREDRLYSLTVSPVTCGPPPRCHAVEIDGRYVDTAIRRWERLTKQEAKDVHGNSFAQAKSDRGADQ